MLKLTQTILNNLKSTPKPISCLHKLQKSTKVEAKPEEAPSMKPAPKNRMVAAVFASLKPTSDEITTPLTDDKIRKATNVNDLLSISEGTGISRRHALKVVSTLAEWSSSGKTQISEFENDARFVKLCRILSKGAKINRNVASRSEDLSTILGVTADEEAARLISSLNLAQMVKVMSTLAGKKRRSVVLLRTLAYNISANNDRLDLKQNADLLYSMCLLNFIDENLLGKICEDVVVELGRNLDKSSAVGSIITSLGLLKYKNSEILDCLSAWMLKNHSICRIQDIFSLFFTLANVNYLPNNSEELFKTLLPLLNIAEARKTSAWLNFVWSLVVLNRATNQQISTVLQKEFLEKVENTDNISAKMKLLNIDGAAKHLMSNYDGVLIDTNSKIHDFTITKTKEKTKFVDNVLDAFKNLLMENHIKINTNSGMGFMIDAECLFDEKCHSLPFNIGYEPKPETTRVAVLVYDYYDMCLGKIEPCGSNVLIARLLEAQNYKILTVPYNAFKMSDKLVHRVQYLESKLKNLLQK